jgi:hypothetical protein
MPFANDAFMQPFVEYGEWVEIDGSCGITYVPSDIFSCDSLQAIKDAEDTTDELIALVRDYYESSTIYSITVTKGFGARMSASGYMDCTEWSVFETEAEAVEYLEDYYGDEEDEA